LSVPSHLQRLVYNFLFSIKRGCIHCIRVYDSILLNDSRSSRFTISLPKNQLITSIVIHMMYRWVDNNNNDDDNDNRNNNNTISIAP